MPHLMTVDPGTASGGHASAAGRPAPRAAAFYDLDGTIVSTNLVHAYWYYARNNQGLWRSVRAAARVLRRVPLYVATNLVDRQIFNELFFRVYEGESDDRLRYLSEELFEKVLKPALYPGATQLVASTRAAG